MLSLFLTNKNSFLFEFASSLLGGWTSASFSSSSSKHMSISPATSTGSALFSVRSSSSFHSTSLSPPPVGGPTIKTSDGPSTSETTKSTASFKRVCLCIDFLLKD